jgi:hypothetical protein
MKTLNLHSWKKLPSQSPKPLGARRLDGYDLNKHIDLATKLVGSAIDRLVLRLKAGYPVSLPLRENFDPDALVQLLTSAGACVSLSGPAERAKSI